MMTTTKGRHTHKHTQSPEKEGGGREEGGGVDSKGGSAVAACGFIWEGLAINQTTATANKQQIPDSDPS